MKYANWKNEVNWVLDKLIESSDLGDSGIKIR